MMDDYKTQFGRASPSLYTGIPYNALSPPKSLVFLMLPVGGSKG